MATKRDITAGHKVKSGRRTQPVYDSYARLSWNPTTRELEKIEDQWSDNITVIDRLGGVLGEQLSDGLSAWKRNVRRPGWERLLERVASGESDGIVIWHTDRLFRQPRDLERLIDLGDKGFLVASAHGARDLADPDDRFILRIEVAHAARSSDDTSRRIKRRFQTLRENGQTTGGARRFGFPGLVPLSPRQVEELANQGKERPIVCGEQVATERRALRDAVADHLAGVASYQQIADRWNEAKLLTANGIRWTAVAVRNVFVRPINAGLIEHEGVVVGQLEGEPILDRATYDKIRAVRAGRRQGRSHSSTYVGTGVLRCGLCGHTLSARKAAAKFALVDGSIRRVYFCPKHRGGCGKVEAAMSGVDQEIKLLVITRLSDPEHAAQVKAYTTRRAERLAEVRQDIADVESLTEALSERLGRREMTLAGFDKANKPLAAQLAELEAERASLESGQLGPVAVATRAEIEAEWATAGPAEQRVMLVRALGRWRLLVDPGRRIGPKFDPTRVRLVPPDAGEVRSAS
jgi:DNA invertase Pin-like site-specific DNA recombinase